MGGIGGLLCGAILCKFPISKQAPLGVSREGFSGLRASAWDFELWDAPGPRRKLCEFRAQGLKMRLAPENDSVEKVQHPSRSSWRTTETNNVATSIP